MVFSSKQTELIDFIDRKVKVILENGGNELTVFTEMAEYMPEMNPIIFAPEKELEMYLAEYKGFYYYIKMLEHRDQRDLFKDALPILNKEFKYG